MACGKKCVSQGAAAGVGRPIGQDPAGRNKPSRKETHAAALAKQAAKHAAKQAAAGAANAAAAEPAGKWLMACGFLLLLGLLSLLLLGLSEAVAARPWLSLALAVPFAVYA